MKWVTTSWTYSSRDVKVKWRREEGTTVCPRSSYRFYRVTYYMKWVATSWTYSSCIECEIRRSECISLYKVTYIIIYA